MTRSDQTQTAILGALSIVPMTGYALREEIRCTLGHFWSESFGQIYPTLAELERDGFVERQEAATSRSSKFSVTEAGSGRLRDLLSEPPQASKPRNGLLLRLFFGNQLGADACTQLVLQARQQAEDTLARMGAAHSELSSNPSLARDAPFIRLTISAGEHAARATIEWADEALAELSTMNAAAVPMPDE